MSFMDYKDPIVSQWNVQDGQKYTRIITNEQQTVVNGMFALVEIPDVSARVDITGMDEIGIDEVISLATEYKVDYLNGYVYFHPSKEGQTITIARYGGRGVSLYPSSRIWTKIDNFGNAVRTLAEVEEEIIEVMEVLSRLDTTIDKAESDNIALNGTIDVSKTKKDELDQSVLVANNINETLSNPTTGTIKTANNVDGILKSTISNANTTKDKLTGAINIGEVNINQVVDVVENTTLIYKAAVSTYSNISSTYPLPVRGWFVNVLDTKKWYRYDGAAWIHIATFDGAGIDSLMNFAKYIWIEEIAVPANSLSFTINSSVGAMDRLIIKDAKYQAEWIEGVHWNRVAQTISFTEPDGISEGLIFKITNIGKDLKLEVDYSKTTLDSHTNIKKTELNNHTASKKTELDTTIASADSSKANLDSSISSANTINNTLSNSSTGTIKRATDANSSLNTSINTAGTSKTNLDNSISSASVSKTNLDSSVSSANSTKTNLDSSISTAGTTKTALDNSISSANAKKVELDNHTAVKKGELDTHSTVKKGELDTHNATKKSELDSHTNTKKTEIDTYWNNMLWTEEKPVPVNGTTLTLTKTVYIGDRLIITDKTYGARWFETINWTRSGQVITFKSAMPEALVFEIINLG